MSTTALVARYVSQNRKTSAAESREFAAALRKSKVALDTIAALLRGRDRVLVAAIARAEQDGLPKGRVWQGRFVDLFESMEPAFADLQEVDQALDAIYLGGDAEVSDSANTIRQVLDLPRKAMTEYAISDIDFAPNPDTGREGITYSVQKLKEWGAALEKWVTDAQKKVRALV